MPDTLPALSGDPDVLVAAIARAAARLAAQDAGRRADPPDENAVEEIAERVVRAAFKQFGVDLDRPESVEDFRDTVAHARRSRKWWDKAGASLVTALTTIMAGGLVAAVMKYGSAVLGGGVK